MNKNEPPWGKIREIANKIWEYGAEMNTFIEQEGVIFHIDFKAEKVAFIVVGFESLEAFVKVFLLGTNSKKIRKSGGISDEEFISFVRETGKDEA